MTHSQIQDALADLMIGERVTVDTPQTTVTGRVAEVGDHSIWLYGHDSEDTDHDRQWRVFRRSVIGLELVDPPTGWTRAEVDQAVGGTGVRPELRLATPPPPRPKPRLSLEEARDLAARANQARWAPDRPEDPDA